MLKLGSLFSGSGGFELAGLLVGIQPVWNSEIEPFPIRVTTRRMPSVRHLGDINDIHGDEIDPVDIITFGSPCQDMSLAGRRAGLDGERSGLFHQAVRIVKEMREKTNGKYPRFIVWENVTGAFSSNKGRDFQAVLTEIARIADEEVPVVPLPDKDRWPGFGALLGDGWSVAYRTFDAQYWGVPQRRRRIYLVADFAGGCAAELLSEPESLPGHSSPGREAWERFARPAQAGAGASGGQVSAGFCTEHSASSHGIGWQEETAPTLRAGVVPAAQVYENHGQDTRFNGPVRVAPTVLATYGTGGNNQPFVVPVTLKIRSGCEGGGKGALMQEDKSATLSTHNDQTLFEPRVYGISSDQSHAMLSDNPKAGIYEASTSRTLDTSGGTPACNQGGMAVVEDVYAVTDGGYTQIEHEKSPTLMARDFKGPVAINQPAYSVRRLTPTECARLQGFPDDWCSGLGLENPSAEEMVLWRDIFDTHSRILGKRTKTDNQIRKWLRDPYTDSAEYKLWGNGIALPCAVFVLERIANNS